MQITESGLPAGEAIHRHFVHRGRAFFVSVEDANHRHLNLWWVDGTVFVLVESVSLPGSGPYYHVDNHFPRDFFAVTTNWIYFIDKRGADESYQLYRTNGDNLTQRVSNFAQNDYVLYDGAKAKTFQVNDTTDADLRC